MDEDTTIAGVASPVRLSAAFWHDFRASSSTAMSDSQLGKGSCSFFSSRAPTSAMEAQPRPAGSTAVYMLSKPGSISRSTSASCATLEARLALNAARSSECKVGDHSASDSEGGSTAGAKEGERCDWP